MTKYLFIDVQKAHFPIRALCKTLEVPESSYFEWNTSGRSNHQARAARSAELEAQIRVIHADSDGTYGSPRIHAELRDAGVSVGLRRVAETMADAGIAGLSGREHSCATTRRDRMAVPVPDLVAGNFTPLTPNALWYGDVTYIWIADKFWYLATVIDGATKELLGWSFADHMRTELVSDALHAAVRRRGGQIPDGVIFHSDRGSQYTSDEYRKVCRSYRIRQSMGRRGVCYDNAAAESFFSILKRELVDRYRWDDANSLRVHLFEWIETWYNSRRRHTSIGMRTPRQAYLDHLMKSAA